MASDVGRTAKNRLALVWQRGLPDHVQELAWTADGTHIVAATIGGPIFAYDRAGTLHHELPGHGFGTLHIAAHPAKPLLASGGQDGSVRVWDLETGGELWQADGGAAWVERLAWNLDGSILASAAGKNVRLWRAESGERLAEFGPHGGTVADIAWKPKANELAVAAYGGIAFYEPDRAEAIRHFEWKGSPLRLAWSPTGAMLAHGNQDASVHFWYADTGRELHMSGYPKKVRELSWDFAGRVLATGGGEVPCLWDCSGAGPEGRTPKMLQGHAGSVTAVQWQRRGFLIATSDDAGRVCVWQPANTRPLLGAANFAEDEISCLAWSPDDSLLAVGSGKGAIALFRVT